MKKTVLSCILFICLTLFGFANKKNQNVAPECLRNSPTTSTVYVGIDLPATFTIDVSDSDGNLYQARWYINWSYKESASVSGYQDSDSYTRTFTSLGTYEVRGRVKDTNGTYCATDVLWTVIVIEHKPESERLNPLEANVQAYTDIPIEFKMSVSDAAGDLVGTDWYVNGENFDGVVSGFEDTDEITYTFTTTGTYTVTGLVYGTNWDYCDETHRAIWTVTVSNHKPESAILEPVEASVQAYTNIPIEFKMSVSDAAGDLVGTDWYVNGENFDGVVSGFEDTDEITYTFTTTGTYTVTGLVYGTNWDYCDETHRAVWNVTVVDDVITSTKNNPDAEEVYVINGSDQSFTASGFDANGDLFECKWYLDDVEVFVYSNLTGTDADAEFNQTFSDIGSYNLKAQFYDSQGDCSDINDGAEWIVNVTPGNSLYVRPCQESILGEESRENALIHYAKNNEIELLIFYDIEDILSDDLLTANLDNFIAKANSNGIKVGGAMHSIEEVRLVGVYNNNHTNEIYSLATEIEFYNHKLGNQNENVTVEEAFGKDLIEGDQYYDYAFMPVLKKIHQLKQNGIICRTESYISTYRILEEIPKITNEHILEMKAYLDCVHLSRYTSTPEDIYPYKLKTGFEKFLSNGFSGQFSVTFSSEIESFGADNNFLGHWFYSEPAGEGKDVFDVYEVFLNEFFADDPDLFEQCGELTFNWYKYRYLHFIFGSHKPESSISLPAEPEIIVDIGTEVEFIMDVIDIDGDLRYTDWYVSGDGNPDEGDVTGDSDTDNLLYTFNEIGIFTVTGVVYSSALIGVEDSGPDALWHACDNDHKAIWTVTVNRIVPPTVRGMYVNEFARILNNEDEWPKLLKFAEDNSITSLTLYQLNSVLPNPDRKAKLVRFIKLAREDYKIQSIGATIKKKNALNQLEDIVTFMEDYPDKYFFDAITTEFEYWNPDTDNPDPSKRETRAGLFEDFKTLLDKMNEEADEKDLIVEAYLSEIWEDETDEIVTRIDRGFVSSYKEDPNDMYSRIKVKTGYLSNSVQNLGLANIEVWPLFSSEFDFYGGEEGWKSFLGPWFRGDNENRDRNLNNAEDYFWKYYMIDNSDNFDYVDITGIQWFDYTHMYAALKDSLPAIQRVTPIGDRGEYNKFTIAKGTEQTFEVDVYDKDSNLNLVKWYLDDEPISDENVAASYTANCLLTHTFDTPGEFIITVKAFDEDGNCSPNVFDGWEIVNFVKEPDKIDMGYIGGHQIHWVITVVEGQIIDNKDITDELSGSAINSLSNPETNIWFKNPFIDNIDINYTLTEPAYVKLYVVNQYGKLEDILIDGNRSKEQKIINWTPKERSSGIYYIILNVNGKTVSSKKALYMR